MTSDTGRSIALQCRRWRKWIRKDNSQRYEWIALLPRRWWRETRRGRTRVSFCCSLVLANANAFGEILLRDIKAAYLPGAATLRIAGSLRADRTLGLIRSLLLAISFSLSNEVSLLLHFAFASRKKALKVLDAFLLVRRCPTS